MVNRYKLGANSVIRRMFLYHMLCGIPRISSISTAYGGIIQLADITVLRL